MTRTLYRRLAGMMQGGGTILWVSLLLPLLLSACTISMEEYLVTEEKKGVDEPYTEVTPYGEVTYQYRKNVTPLNGRPLEYMAMMNDSVIWFMDNLPSKWMPKEGGYIAANCSRTIPTGIHAKVRSVTRENGMIRVEFQPAPQEEVFEYLTADIDFGYDVPNVNDLDSVEAQTRGWMVTDSVIIDMSLFDRMENPMTRADNPADHKKDTTIKWSYTKDWKYIGVNLEYNNTQHRRFHLKDNGKGYREEWTDTNEEITLAFDVEAGPSKSRGYKNYKNPKDVEDVVNKILAAPEFATMKSKTFKMATRNICIPIPGSIFCVLINFDASAGWELRGVVHAKYHHLTPTIRRGYILDGDTKTPVEREFASDTEFDKNEKIICSWKQGLHHYGFSELYFGGSFDAWGRVRGGVGFIVGNPVAGAGVVVGLEGKAGFKASVKTEYLGDGNDKYTIYDQEQAMMEPYIQLNAYVDGVLNVLGHDVDLGGTTFSLAKTDWAMNPNAVVNPRLCDKSYKGISYKDENTGVTSHGVELDVNIGFKKLQTFFTYAESKAQWQWPCVRVYADNLKSGKYAQVGIPGREVEAGETYNFVINTIEKGLPDTEEYHIVPCIEDGYRNIVTEFRNNVMVLAKADPKIIDTKIYQWYGEPLSEEDFNELVKKNPMLKFYKHTDFVEYAFTTVVRIKNASTITKWGLNFKVYDEGNKNKVFINKDVQVLEGRGETKTGKYSVISSFIMNKVPKNYDEYPTIVAQPYFETSLDGGFEKKQGSISKPCVLYYPYEREGGAYTTGTTEYVDIN